MPFLNPQSLMLTFWPLDKPKYPVLSNRQFPHYPLFNKTEDRLLLWMSSDISYNLALLCWCSSKENVLFLIILYFFCQSRNFLFLFYGFNKLDKQKPKQKIFTRFVTLGNQILSVIIIMKCCVKRYGIRFDFNYQMIKRQVSETGIHHV